MKVLMLLLTLLALTVFTLASSAESATKPPEYDLQIEANLNVGTMKWQDIRYVIVGVPPSPGKRLVCDSLIRLEALVASLPRGAILNWDIEDVSPNPQSAAMPDSELARLKTLCQQNGIDFKINPGG